MHFAKKIFLSALAVCLVFAVSASADERLLGSWRSTYFRGNLPAKVTMAFKADGTVLMEERVGDAEQSFTAAWETEEKTLRLSDENENYSFEYRIEGSRLFLRQLGGDENGEFFLARAELPGKWAMRGWGVGYSGGEGDVFVLLLGNDGRALVERTQGCMILTAPARWESNGSELRLFPAENPEERKGGHKYSVDGIGHWVNMSFEEETLYEYLMEGDILTLRVIRSDGPYDEAGEEMLLHWRIF